MNQRQLSRPVYQSSPMEIDYQALEGFQLDTINELKQIRSDTQIDFNRLSLRISEREAVLTWVGTHRPEAIQDYNTTKAVANRLEDSNYISEADMKQEMQVTP